MTWLANFVIEQSLPEPLAVLARFVDYFEAVQLGCLPNIPTETRANIRDRQPLSLLLKLSPLVDELALYDIQQSQVKGVAVDLSHISSPVVSNNHPS